MRIAFSVLMYKPSFIADEKINLGILFHNISTNETTFEITKKWNRVQNFDDSIKIDFFKEVIKGIGLHAKKSLETTSLENYIKRYNNEIKFINVMYHNLDTFEEYLEFIDVTKKMFMPQDFEESSRPTKKQQVSYFKSILKSYDISYSTRSIKGLYKDDISFDYVIGNNCFKILEFNGKNIKSMIRTAKLWAYNANELKDTYNVFFVYDVVVKDENFDIIMSILKSCNSTILSKAEYLESIQELNYKQCNFSSI